MKEHRIVGPPGCGKTTYLKRQFENAGEHYRTDELFACSLTRAAAHEIASRVAGVPERNIGTLHSHAYRALKYPKIVETAEGLREWNQFCGTGAWRISNRHAADPENAQPEPTAIDTTGAELMQHVGVLRQRMVDRRLWPAAPSAFMRRWEQFKAETGRVDFTDLIEMALEGVSEIDGCAVLFIDEAQDLSRLEFALARKWGEAADQLVVVGDPDQNLYEWRGSDPGAFFASEVVSEHVLSQSYRVPKAVHQSATRWVNQIPNRRPAAYEPTDWDGEVRIVSLNYRDADPFVTELERKLNETNDETIMVLTSCGYMLSAVIARLRSQGIPFHNPYRIRQGAWNPLKGAGRLLAYLRPSVDVWEEEARFWTWDDLRRWTEVLQSKDVFTRGFKSVIKARCMEDRFKDSLANSPIGLQQLLENLVSDSVREAVVEMDVDWWESNLRHTDRKTQQFPLAVARRYGAGRLREKPRLILGTIHSVKGGEADHVYLLPDLSSPGYFDAWRSTGKAKSAVIRQFYVGMTRARQSLTLCAPSSGMAVTWLGS